MGWRSWNCYHGDVSQAKIEATVDAVVKNRDANSGGPGGPPGPLGLAIA